MGAEPPHPRRERVILADPDGPARAAAAAALRADGYAVAEAATGPEAEAAFWAEPNTELLVAAFALPGMGGPRLASILRALRPGLRVMIVCEAGSQGASPGLRSVPRPRTPSDLLAAVRQALAAS